MKIKRILAVSGKDADGMAEARSPDAIKGFKTSPHLQPGLVLSVCCVSVIACLGSAGFLLTICLFAVAFGYAHRK